MNVLIMTAQIRFCKAILLLAFSLGFCSCAPIYTVNKLGEPQMSPQAWESYLKSNSPKFKQLIIKYDESIVSPYVGSEAYLLKNPLFSDGAIQGELSLSLDYMKADLRPQKNIVHLVKTRSEMKPFFDSMVIYVNRDVQEGDRRIPYANISYVETFDKNQKAVNQVKNTAIYTILGTSAVGIGACIIVVWRFINSFG